MWERKEVSGGSEGLGAVTERKTVGRNKKIEGRWPAHQQCHYDVQEESVLGMNL